MVRKEREISKRSVLKKATPNTALNRRAFLGKVGAATIVGTASVESVAATGSEKETYTLESFDGTKLIARLYKPSNPSGTDYMVPNSWNFSRKEAENVARQLTSEGHTVVQYDQRGYGKSQGKPEDNRKDWAAVKDYAAIVQFFVEEGRIEHEPTLKLYH